MTQQRRYNNYTLAIMVSFAAALGISLAFLLSSSLLEGLISQGMYDFLAVSFGVMMVAQATAGGGYVGRAADIATNRNTIFQIGPKSPSSNTEEGPSLIQVHRAEFVGLMAGLGLAVILTVLLFIKKAGSLIFHRLPIVGPLLFLVANMGMMAGLFGRMGRVVDYFRENSQKSTLFRGNNINYTFAVMGGIVVGVVLAAVILGVVGVTSAMTFGGAIPVWAGGISFFFTMVGAAVSTSGYIGRAFDLGLGQRTIVQSKTDTQTILERANYETVPTVIGIGVGIILATALVASSAAVSTGLFGLGLPFWASTPLIYATFIAFCAGTANRWGFCANQNKLGSTPTPSQPPPSSGPQYEALPSSDHAAPLQEKPRESSDGQHVIWIKNEKSLSQAEAVQLSMLPPPRSENSGNIQDEDLEQAVKPKPKSRGCF